MYIYIWIPFFLLYCGYECLRYGRDIYVHTRLEILAGTPGDQLLGDVLATTGVRHVRVLGHADVRLPIPVGRVRVQPSRWSVRHPGRGDQPDGFAFGHRPVGYGADPILGHHRPGTVVQLHLGRQTEHLVVGLHARQVRGGRARRVGHLFVHAIRLQHKRVGDSDHNRRLKAVLHDVPNVGSNVDA